MFKTRFFFFLLIFQILPWILRNLVVVYVQCDQMWQFFTILAFFKPLVTILPKMATFLAIFVNVKNLIINLIKQ